MQNKKIDHCLGLLKACLKRVATGEGRFVVPVQAYGVSGIIVSCYNTIRDHELITNIVSPNALINNKLHKINTEQFFVRPHVVHASSVHRDSLNLSLLGAFQADARDSVGLDVELNEYE